MAEILHENKTKFTLKQLVEMSRLWRLDIGESVMDIEKGINNDYHTAISIRGRVLDKNEVLS